MQTALKVITVILGIALVTSVAANLYLYNRNSNLNGQLATASSQYAALAQGTFIRNGTTYDEIGLQLSTLGNDTTIYFRGVAFTYIMNHNTTEGTAIFEINFAPAVGGGSQVLSVNDTTATTAKTSEVYTYHQGPRAGLGMNLGDPSMVFLFVSV